MVLCWVGNNNDNIGRNNREKYIMAMDFGALMKMFGGAGQGQMPVPGADEAMKKKPGMLQQLGDMREPDGSLINTNAKTTGGYTDAGAAALDGAVKGGKMGGPVGAAVGAILGTATGFQKRRGEHRQNQARFEIGGRQQAADSYHAFDKVIGGLR